ncbi:ATP-dependent RNA helicase [Tulasnella sp. JGI-2019a]|nr:ATP-dependent RNA helicase [Tulasnella sp. JGI-2019a]
MEPTAPSRSALKRKLLNVRARYSTHLIKRRRLSHSVPKSNNSTVYNKGKGLSMPNNGEKMEKKTKGRRKIFSADELAWKPVTRPRMGGELGPEGAILMLEEIEGVNIVYGDERGQEGRLDSGYYFQVTEPSTSTLHKSMIIERAEKNTEAGPSSSSLLAALEEDAKFRDFDGVSLLPSWNSLALHPAIKRAIHTLKFTSPTEIQKRAIPPALSGRDVIGVAETGSGKTLAYGLPIINHVLSAVSPTLPNEHVPRSLAALILAPTRELAMQVADHLKAIVSHLSPTDEKGKGKPPIVSVGVVIGGIDSHKQKRIIKRGMDVMIATPGRLWDIMSEDESVADSIRQIRFLVLDEADRMIESGHFAELEKIIKLTFRTPVDEVEATENVSSLGFLPSELGNSHKPNESLQTLIFSATLSKDLQKNLKKKGDGKKKKKQRKVTSTLDDLLMRLDFRDEDPEVIDLSPQGGVVESLQESKVECLVKDKDVYLYYFLLRYPGRTLVFLSAIDGIRRLLPILKLLGINAFPLHADLQQKQRLTNLEKFRETSNAVLIATDVASRGLDVPSVDHVIHYQVPRSADVYVHRSGRTARAKKQGFSMLLVGPDERRLLRSLMTGLGREAGAVPDLIVDLDIVDKLKYRVSLARQIDSASHKITKANHDRNWMKKTAEEMEVEVDSDFMGESADEEGMPSSGSKKHVKEKNQIASLKSELSYLLRQPLVARGISMKYITSGSRSVVDEIVAGTNHSAMIGVENTGAGRDSVRR